jgi:predicted dehydrogenase
MMAPIRAAVLGIGFSANVFQIPFIVRSSLSMNDGRNSCPRQLALPEVYKLHSILERKATPDKSAARDKYGHLGVKVVTTFDDVIGDPEVDLVCWIIWPLQDKEAE